MCVYYNVVISRCVEWMCVFLMLLYPGVWMCGCVDVWMCGVQYMFCTVLLLETRFF